MIVEYELGGQEGHAVAGAAAQGLVDGQVEAARVVLVAGDLDVLEEPDELGDAPAELARVRLDQDQLDEVDDQEAPDLLAVLPDHCAGDQVAVVCEEKEKKGNGLVEVWWSWGRMGLLMGDISVLTQVEDVVDLDAAARVRQGQLGLDLVVQGQRELADQEEYSDGATSSFDLQGFYRV